MQTETDCLMNNLCFHIVLLLFWKCVPRFLSNPVLLDSDASVRSKSTSLSRYWRFVLKPSQAFPVRVGALTASPLPDGWLPGFRASSGTGQLQAVPVPPSMTGGGRGATARDSPYPWELLLT